MLHQSLNFEKKNPTVRDTGTLGLKSHLVSEKVCVMSHEAGWSCDRSFGGLPASSYCIFYVSYRFTLVADGQLIDGLGAFRGFKYFFILV